MNHNLEEPIKAPLNKFVVKHRIFDGIFVLCRCSPAGLSVNGFQYGLTGDRVVVDRKFWNGLPELKDTPVPHGLKYGIGNYHVVTGRPITPDWDWLVVKAENVIDIGFHGTFSNFKCKFEKGTILYRGDKHGLSNFTDVMALDSRDALEWAVEIGDKEIMRDRIKSADAYQWARRIGDREVMRSKIKGEWDAFEWAQEFGDLDHMSRLIRSSKAALKFSYHYPHFRSVMKSLITEPAHAFEWAFDYGDVELMEPIIRGTPYWKVYLLRCQDEAGGSRYIRSMEQYQGDYNKVRCKPDWVFEIEKLEQGQLMKDACDKALAQIA